MLRDISSKRMAKTIQHFFKTILCFGTSDIPYPDCLVPRRSDQDLWLGGVPAELINTP